MCLTLDGLLQTPGTCPFGRRTANPSPHVDGRREDDLTILHNLAGRTALQAPDRMNAFAAAVAAAVPAVVAHLVASFATNGGTFRVAGPPTVYCWPDRGAADVACADALPHSASVTITTTAARRTITCLTITEEP